MAITTGKTPSSCSWPSSSSSGSWACDDRRMNGWKYRHTSGSQGGRSAKKWNKHAITLKKKKNRQKRKNPETHTLNSSHRHTLMLNFQAGTELGRECSTVIDPKTRTAGIWFSSPPPGKRQICFRDISSPTHLLISLFMQETLTERWCHVKPQNKSC